MKEEKLWTAKFIMVVVINALNGLALYISNPIFAKYLVVRGVDFAYTGIISSLLSWIAMGFRPFSGAMSDHLNKKTLLFIAYLLTGICLFSYSLTDSVTLIIIIRIIHGIAFAVSGTISMSFATTFIPKKQIAEGISYLGMSSLIGSMLGPQIGTMIFNAVGVNYCFYISAMMCVLCLIFLSTMKYQTSSKNENKVQRKLSLDSFFAKELTLYVVLISILTLGNGIISYYLVDYGDSKGIANISLFFTIYSLTLLICKPFIGKIQDKKGVKVILYPAFLIYSAGMFILSKAETLLPCLLAGVFKGLGQGNGTPAIQAESVKTLDSDRSGVAISTCMIGQDIGNALGPIFASFLAESVGYEKMFAVYAGILIIGFIIYFVSNYRKVEK